MQKLENENLQIVVSEKGAELQNVVFKGNEMLWQGNPEWWGRRAPVLFPVVGKCHQDQINVNGRFYPIGQHGFARDRQFEVLTSSSDAITLALKGQADNVFPFEWQLEVSYHLQENGIRSRYQVQNLGKIPLPYAIGAHPGFLVPNSDLGQAVLIFEQAENFERHLLNRGLFSGKSQLLEVVNETHLPLHAHLFDLDAIVLFNVKSNSLIWQHNQQPYMQMSWYNMPHLGIWTQKGGELFLCLEPWAGFADFEGYEGEFNQKAGINLCQVGESNEHGWEIGFW